MMAAAMAKGSFSSSKAMSFPIKFSRITCLLEVQFRFSPIFDDNDPEAEPNYSWGNESPIYPNGTLCQRGNWKLPLPDTYVGQIVGNVFQYPDGKLAGNQTRLRFKHYTALPAIVAWEEYDYDENFDVSGVTTQKANIPPGGGWSDWIGSTPNSTPSNIRIYGGPYLKHAP